jgi:hypothetical protein
MNKMIQRLSGAAAFSGVVGALCFTGCAPVDATDGEEQVDEAQQAQIDPGLRVWRQMTLNFADPSSTAFATVYVFNSALGPYQTGTEYWHVNLDSVDLIGRYPLDIVSTDQRDRVAPPDPGYPSEQGFSLPEFPESGWGPWWSSDPVSGGSLYSGPNRISLRLTASTSPASLERVTWYQVIASTATPYNLTPNGAFTLGASSVTVPSGYRGYDVSQATQ